MTQTPTTAETIAAFRSKLEAVGIIPGEIVADGTLLRCGTTVSPKGKDGAYIAHIDSPATVWWQNHQTGETGTWSPLSGSPLTEADHQAIAARKAARAAAQAEDSEQYAREAQAAWDAAKEENDRHAYLERKGVPSCGLRTGSDGRLVVPLRDACDKLWTLQHIAPDGTKRLFTGGRKSGCFFTIPAKDGSDTGPLLIAEGYATIASLHMATGHACVMAVDTSNLKAVSLALRRLWPAREIILCADNDCASKDGSHREKNPGLEAAQAAASSIGGAVALCPAHEGRSCDFNDLHQARGLDAVRAVVERARGANACPMPEGFRMVAEGSKAGLYRITTDENGEEREERLGPPLHVLGKTRDADSTAWGLMLEWRDPDGIRHRWAMPSEILHQYRADWLTRLVDGGWIPTGAHKRHLAAFLTAVCPQKRFRCVPRVGWHEDAFVLPDRAFQATPAALGEEVVLQAAGPAVEYRTVGAFEDWQAAARLAAGNCRTEFFLCAAFAGPLLGLAGVVGGGFHLHGGSSCGKTTSQVLGASVWGAPAQFTRTWRTTDNALEGIAAAVNDTLLVLDEMTQATPETVAKAAYMLADGQGKSRAARDGSTRPPASWRVLFLSSGEHTLEHQLAEGGRKPQAGMAVRLVDIPADAGMGWGVFEDLHGHAHGATLAEAITKAVGESYGHAGPKFLQWVVENHEDLCCQTAGSVETMAAALSPLGADGQVRRVANRFALVALAGQLAQEAGVLPPELSPLEAAKRCFEAWLAGRGTVGPSEDAAILAEVRRVIEVHGASRFQAIGGEAATCHNRIGFRNDAAREFIFLPEAFRAEVCKGFDVQRAGRALLDAGWLRPDGSGRGLQARRSLGELGRQRCYVVSIPEDGSGADLVHESEARPARMVQ